MGGDGGSLFVSKFVLLTQDVEMRMSFSAHMKRTIHG